VGAVLMTLLMIVILAASVIESRDRLRRDSLMDYASLRAWYEARHARRGGELDRENLEDALRRARSLRRWGPVTLSASTLLLTVGLTYLAVRAVPGAESAWPSPERLLALVPAEVLVETALVLALVPILIVEGILAALYVAELDIGRLRRLLESLN
jgi:hypothetical protein